jgi:hypothetical protein
MKFENFKSNFEAAFQQGMKGEGSWIDTIEAEEESVVQEALSMSAEIFLMKRQAGIHWNPPGLKEFKWELVKVKKDRRRDSLNLCQSSCRLCRGTSGLLIVEHHLTGKVLNPNRPEPIPEIELYIKFAACPEKSKSSVSYYGWPMDTAIVEIRQYLWLCDALAQQQKTGKLPVKPEFCDIPQMDRVCPGCGASMRLNAVPECLGLLKGLGNSFDGLLESIVCDNCFERRYA